MLLVGRSLWPMTGRGEPRGGRIAWRRSRELSWSGRGSSAPPSPGISPRKEPRSPCSTRPGPAASPPRRPSPGSTRAGATPTSMSACACAAWPNGAASPGRCPTCRCAGPAACCGTCRPSAFSPSRASRRPWATACAPSTAPGSPASSRDLRRLPSSPSTSRTRVRWSRRAVPWRSCVTPKRTVPDCAHTAACSGSGRRRAGWSVSTRPTATSPPTRSWWRPAPAPPRCWPVWASP